MLDSQPVDVGRQQPTYLTLLEAANYLRISRRTLYRWLREGKLECFRVGNTTRIPLTAIEAFASRNTGVQTHAVHSH